MLALRGISAFPDMLLSFDVERQISIAALDAAMDADRIHIPACQRYKRRRSGGGGSLYYRNRMLYKANTQDARGSIRVMVEGSTGQDWFGFSANILISMWKSRK